DERDELVKRADELRVDRTIMSAEQLTAAVANLTRLREAGLYKEALAYPGLGSVRVTAAWEHESKAGSEAVATLEPNGAPKALPDIRKAAPSAVASTQGGPIVQWDTPIPPPEAYEILARMSAFKEATVYKVGESYLGKD